MNPENIIISRTDSIGDVVLTLPMAKIIKEQFPDCRIAFLGKEYTRPVIKSCEYIDQFITLNDFMSKKVQVAGKAPQCIVHVLPHKAIARRAKDIGIPLRIGTRNRLFHWRTCNKLVKLSRKNSDLHESQLNLKLLAPLNITKDFPLSEIQNAFGLERILPLSPALSSLLDPSKYNLILHAKSQGNGMEWGLDNFKKLVDLTDSSKFRLFISGTDAERPALQPLLDHAGDKAVDLTGKMDLFQFMSFIKRADGLLASGTGPLHLSAALGKDAFGLFPSVRPIHPGRWAPLGPGAHVFETGKSCKNCGKKGMKCDCMSDIKPTLIEAAILKAYDAKFGVQ
ncbi:MAG: glycosyltransferase family 9 protein [Flavitalea sp.]